LIPDIDSQIGISLYTTNFSGIGGKIRITSEDFEVSELISKRAHNSITDQSGYAVYKLNKKKIDTNHALSGIFRKTGVHLKALGLKDASAVTEQFVGSPHKGNLLMIFLQTNTLLLELDFQKNHYLKKI